MHKDTYIAIIEYLDALPAWVKADDVSDWISEIYNELEVVKRV